MRKRPINQVQKYSLVKRINEVGERVHNHELKNKQECIIMNLKKKTKIWKNKPQD